MSPFFYVYSHTYTQFEPFLCAKGGSQMFLDVSRYIDIVSRYILDVFRYIHFDYRFPLRENGCFIGEYE